MRPASLKLRNSPNAATAIVDAIGRVVPSNVSPTTSAAVEAAANCTKNSSDDAPHRPGRDRRPGRAAAHHAPERHVQARHPLAHDGDKHEIRLQPNPTRRWLPTIGAIVGPRTCLPAVGRRTRHAPGFSIGRR
ncbi:MAG: hypothetical protein WA900_01050 [Casimicrobiaceae bacterium]